MPESEAWVTNKPKITDSANLKLIQQALERGPVYLRHALYHGGGCAHWDTPARYDQFVEHLSHSNPGDWFYVWSITELIGKHLYFLHRQYVSFDVSSEQTARDFSEIKAFLGSGHQEVLLVFIPSKPHNPKTVFTDLDGYGDILDMATEFTGRCVTLYAFNMEVLWEPEHLLIDAKFPNAAGEVPIGGAY
jgi:hypothetical protein